MTPEQIYNNNSKLPLSLHSNLCDNYNIETGGKLREYANLRYPQATESINENFKSLKTKYDRHKLDRLIGRQIISLNQQIVKGAFEFVSVPTKSSGVSFLLVKGTEKFMDKLFESTLELYDEQSKMEAEKLVGKHLQIIRDSENIKFEDLTGLSSKDAAKLIFQSDKGIFDYTINEFQDEDKPNVIYHMSRILETKMTNALALNQLADNARDLQVTNMKTNIDNLKVISRSLIKFQEVTTLQLKNINSSIDIIETNVTKLRNDVNLNTKDISLLKEFMFNNLDVDQQIIAIEQGMRGNPDSSENKKLRLQLEAFIARKKLSEEITNYVNGAQSIMNIANNIGDELGINPEFLKRANDLVNTGATLTNAYLAFSSGNMLGAVSQASNLFGGNSDPASNRHAQIMKRLDIIDKKLDHVIENQKLLLENQQKMINLQIDTLKAISLLSKDIDSKFQKIMEKLDFIHADIIYNREVMLNFAFRDIENLEIFVRKYEQKKYKIQYGRLAVYADRVQHWRNYSFAFLGARQVLLQQLNPNKIGDFIKLESYSKKGDFKEINQTLKTFEVFVSFIVRYTSQDKIITSGLLASKSILDIENKQEILASKTPDYFFNALKNMVSIFHLEVITELLVKTHDYYRLINYSKDSELLSLDKIYDNNTIVETGIDLLNDLEKIINIAIIQENILSGDIMLQILYDNLIEEIKKDTTKSIKYDSIINILHSKELFKKNFTKYLLKSELLKTKTTLIQYYTALNVTDNVNKILRNMFSELGLKNGLEYIDGNSKYSKGWYIHLPYDKDGEYVSLKLPIFSEYDNGRIHYRPEMERLHQLKNIVIDEIFDYENSEFINTISQIELSNNLVSL